MHHGMRLHCAILALIALLILSSCGGSDKPSGNDVKMGFVFATSGDYTAYGNSQKMGAELAVREINDTGRGPTLAPVFEDTAGQPDRALAAFQKLINTDRVVAIVGPTLSNEALTSDPEAQRAGVPVLAVSNTASGVTDTGDYIFRDSLAEFQVIPETIRRAKEQFNLTTASLLYARDDPFTKSEIEVFKQELQKNNIKILSEQTFSIHDVSYEAQLNAIKRDNPDALVVSALAGPAGTILRQARGEVGISTRVHIIGGNGFNSPQVIQAAGPAADGLIAGAVWSTNAPDLLSERFVRAYSKAVGKEPDQLAAQAYAGVYILYDAITRASISGKSLQDARAAIRDALKNTRDLPTVLGKFSFTDKRDADHLPVVQIVRDGRFGVLGSASGEGGKPTVSPTP